MPATYRGVIVENIDPTTVRVTIGNEVFTRDASWFFERGEDLEHVKRNLRLAKKLGGVVDPTTLEFVNLINNTTRGVEGPGANYYIKSVGVVDPDGVELQFNLGPSRNGSTVSHTFTMRASYFDEPDENRREDILYNMRSFLREEGASTFTQQVINKIASWTWRY